MTAKDTKGAKRCRGSACFSSLSRFSRSKNPSLNLPGFCADHSLIPSLTKTGDESEAWRHALPPGPDRDSAIRGFAKRSMGANPQPASEWVASIQDTVARRSALEMTLRKWCDNDLGNAIRWLQTTPTISEEDREALLKGK